MEEWIPSYGYASQTEATPSRQYWGERIPREAALRLTERHPGLEITTEQVDGRPLTVLVAAAQEAEVLVLGSRGLAAMTGFLVGSVSQAVLAHAERPVVVVRPGAWLDADSLPASGGDGPRRDADRPVVLGLDLSHPSAELLGHAFDAAAVRRVPLRVIHGWSMPLAFAFDPTLLPPEVRDGMATSTATALGDELRPWRDR
ncbi:universal stress protein [Streptomyces sp. XY332]|uniref:universal stress protein n=1 Tax=Streptomyces sp. XY332 TaxID=1415561 RepID=UPI0006B1F401|nr:universal stress protein [Streptomyces sp. XY332]